MTQTPILFSIGNLNFYTHGIFAVVGIIAAALVMHFLSRKNLKYELLFDTIIYSVLVGIIGARITFFVLYHNQFSQFRQLFYIWEGGLVSFGGFIAGGLTFYFILKSQKQPILPWLNLLSLGFLAGLAIGRFGEYISGEDFSTPVASQVTRIFSVNLAESVWCAGLFLILLFVYVKFLKNKDNGLVFALSVWLYSMGRFVIDFWRNESKIALGLSLGQFTCLALALVVSSVLVYTLLARKDRYGTISRRLSRKSKNSAT